MKNNSLVQNSDYSLIVLIPWNSTPPTLWSGYKKHHATLCSYQRWFLHPATTSDRPLPWQRRISDLIEPSRNVPPKKNTVSLKATSPCLVLFNCVSWCIQYANEKSASCGFWRFFGEFVWTSFFSAYFSHVQYYHCCEALMFRVWCYMAIASNICVPLGAGGLVPFGYCNLLSHETNLLTFHYTGWFKGILIMVYYNPYITGK